MSHSNDVFRDNGLVKISDNTLRRLSRVGILAENIGVLRIASGTVFATIEICHELEQAIRVRMKEVGEPGDFEASATLASAYANIVKAKAAMLKAAGGFQVAPDKEKRARKSFGKDTRLGRRRK